MLKQYDFHEKHLNSLLEAYPVANKDSIKDELLSEIKKGNRAIQHWLKKENPFCEEQRKYKIANNSLKQKCASIEDIESDFSNYQRLASKTINNIDNKFWISEIEKLKNKPELDILVEKFSGSGKPKKDNKSGEENRLICRALLQKQWQKSLDQKHSEWELNAISKFRNDLLKKLSDWLELLQKLDDTLNDLSLDTGLLLDLSKGNVSLSEIESLRQWASYIAEDDGVRCLCDMMGRLRQAEKTKRKELVKNITTVQEFVPDVNSKEEIVGIHLGRDIERALPQELALLADDEISILFDMKFIEGRLSCFEMEGTQQKTICIEEKVVIETEEKEELGPIIICVDTSGSMQGPPEMVAKAVTLFMATSAMKQDRNCFLINFSTGIETLDLSKGVGLAKVIAFLQRSFHGGTDASPALDYAVKIMSEKKYKKADLLMVSDFIMASLPAVLQDKISKAKQSKNKFYSLTIGDVFLENRAKSIFDNEWVYNPSNSSIHSLQAMVNTI